MLNNIKPPSTTVATAALHSKAAIRFLLVHSLLLHPVCVGVWSCFLKLFLCINTYNSKITST